MAEASTPALDIRDLHVHYGESHALQGIFLTLDSGVLSVVGRNGMGKTTLCNAIVGLKPATSGSIRVFGREITGLAPHEIHRLGVAYVPQGRRCWPSLTVDEHLRLVENRSRQARWTIERSTRLFRVSPSGAATAAPSFPAANSRCWRFAARCSAIRRCW